MKTVEIKTGVKIQNKQEAIRLAVSEKIRNGEYGEKLPGVRELAKNFSVNVITLRKALSTLVKDGTIYAEKGKGIFVNTRKKTCIGIIGSTHEKCLFDKGEYFGDVFSGMLEHIEKNNDFFSFQSKQKDGTYIELLRENSSAGGFVVFAPDKKEERELQDIRMLTPIVVVGTTTVCKNLNCVDSDNYGDSFNAVMKLIEEGKRRILFLSNKMWTRTHELRCDGYMDAIARSGIRADKKMMVTEDPKTTIFKDRILSIFNSKNPPDAIFAANSYAAFKLLEIDEIRKDNLELTVYDDPKGRISRFGIAYSVIQQPLYEIGVSAIKRLYELIGSRDIEAEQIRLPSQLIAKRGKHGEH